MALVEEGAVSECEIYRANQHTLVIPVGRLAAVAGEDGIDDTPEDADAVSHRNGTTQKCRVSPYTAARGERHTNRDGARSLPRVAARTGIQIICRYDSVPESDDPPSASCLQPATAAPSVDIGDFSSIVEIDGDCVIIHSRQEETEEEAPGAAAGAAAGATAGATAEEGARKEEVVSSEEEEVSSEEESDQEEEEDEAPVALGTPISERCRRFYESRLQSRPAPPVSVDAGSDSDDTEWGPGSVDSGRESGPDSGVSTRQLGRKPPLKPVSSLERKMALLRREMWSLMHQDDALFRQLLALNDSIEALKQADAVSLSSASSLSSLAELADEESCSPSSTLSSASSGRQSLLSADSNYMLIKTKYRSQPQLAAELLTAEGGGRLTSSLSYGEMSPLSLRQTSTPSLRPLDKLRPPSGHRKQASFDSGIVDQELRGNT